MHIQHMKKLRNFKLATLCFVAVMATSYAYAQSVPKTTVFIIGADSEIGNALVRRYAGRQWAIIATVENSGPAVETKSLAEQFPNIEVENLNIRDFDEIDMLAAKYQNRPIDILIYAKRLDGGDAAGGLTAQRFGQFDFEAFDEVLTVNAVAALKVFEAFNEHVQSSRLKKVIKLSSSSGSVSNARNCTRCGNFFGRTSHAAGNMVMRRLFQYHRSADTGVVVGIVDPGPVNDASMEALVADNFPAALLVSAEDSATGMMHVIDGFGETNSGSIFNYRGESVPW